MRAVRCPPASRSALATCSAGTRRSLTTEETPIQRPATSSARNSVQTRWSGHTNPASPFPYRRLWAPLKPVVTVESSFGIEYFPISAVMWVPMKQRIPAGVGGVGSRCSAPSCPVADEVPDRVPNPSSSTRWRTARAISFRWAPASRAPNSWIVTPDEGFPLGAEPGCGAPGGRPGTARPCRAGFVPG